MNALFDYRWNAAADAGADAAAPLPQVGQLALVPFGRREVMGLIVGVSDSTDVPAAKLKDVLAVRSQLAPLSAQWLALAAFAADYYQRPLGEVALPGLPKNLRVLTTVALDRAIKKLGKLADAHDGTPLNMPALNPAQQEAADAIGGAQGFKPTLLYGVTGSGKTEVYLQACAQVLAREDDAQILILVPEINLTPQLEGNIRARFPASCWRPCIAACPRASACCTAGRPQGQARMCSARGGHPGVVAEAQTDRHRRGARSFLQATGRLALFRARPGRVARLAIADSHRARFGHALAGKLAPRTDGALPQAGIARTGRQECGVAAR